MTKERASEGGHWYDRDGAPAYTVIGKNGRERATHVGDARKLNLVPSVTTIIKCAAAPGLEKWKQEQVLLAALTLPRKEGESGEEWKARIYEDAKEQAEKASERGTQLHAAIQRWYEGYEITEAERPYVQGAVDAVAAWLED